MLAEKTLAPDFSALDQQGNRHELKDYQGKWLLLYFYPKDNTPGCTKEACQFRDYFEDLKPEVSVLGVSSDSVKSHSKFATQYRLPFPLLADSDKEIIRLYHANGLFFTKRISYLIDPHGTIAKVYEKVDPAKHAMEVLKHVQQFKQQENSSQEPLNSSE
jgi:peroxiredoxin Q/BCP